SFYFSLSLPLSFFPPSPSLFLPPSLLFSLSLSPSLCLSLSFPSPLPSSLSRLILCLPLSPSLCLSLSFPSPLSPSLSLSLSLSPSLDQDDCFSLRCDVNAQCVLEGGHVLCRCLTGFSGH